jgi:hypothetical protein
LRWEGTSRCLHRDAVRLDPQGDDFGKVSVVIVRVTTETGSVWDVDHEHQTACRRGADYGGTRAAPAPRPYVDAAFVRGVLWIVWDEDGHATHTSRVVSVELVSGD